MATKHTDEELERRVKLKELEERARKQKRLLDALSDSEEKYRRLAKDIFEGIYCVDTHGVTTYVSPATESLLGYRSEEIINRPFTDFIFPQDLPHMKKRFQDALNGNGEPAEYRISEKIRWLPLGTRFQ